jgi:hypothetical protein
MQIYVHKNNEQLGPFTEAEIKAQLAAGTLSLQDHVWWQGQANWVTLGQSSLAATLSPTAPAAAPATPSPLPGAAAPSVSESVPQTSKLAIWALICGCLSLFCSLFAAIPAIILGHMGLSAIKKNPALQGRGMALAGAILGYAFTALIIVFSIILVSLGNNVTEVFKTIEAQENAALTTNSADQSATTPNLTTNAPEQTTPTSTPAPTPTPDQSTNSAPAAPAPTPNQSTNSASASTNSPDSSTNSSPSTAPSTNAPDSSTNAAPMNP